MTYHILYNPAANNALVGLSDTLPTIPEGIARKTPASTHTYAL